MSVGSWFASLAEPWRAAVIAAPVAAVVAALVVLTLHRPRVAAAVLAMPFLFLALLVAQVFGYVLAFGALVVGRFLALGDVWRANRRRRLNMTRAALYGAAIGVVLGGGRFLTEGMPADVPHAVGVALGSTFTGAVLGVLVGLAFNVAGGRRRA